MVKWGQSTGPVWKSWHQLVFAAACATWYVREGEVRWVPPPSKSESFMLNLYLMNTRFTQMGITTRLH